MYTLITAKYANTEQTAALVNTVEAGTVLVSDRDTPELWEQMLESAGEPAAFLDNTWRAATWAQFRELRDVYLYRLEGISGRAYRSGDEAFASAIDVFIQGILDIPQDPTTQPEVTPTANVLGKAINARFSILKNVAVGYDPQTALTAYPERKAVIDKVFK